MAAPGDSPSGAAPGTGTDTVLVVDYGAQYAQLIARRVRECHVYSEIVPPSMPVADILAKHPKGIILSGGPASVYAPGAPRPPSSLLQTGVPTLGICYGFQAMAQALEGHVEHSGVAEYGPTQLSVLGAGLLLDGLPAQQPVWMSHGDSCAAAPPGFTVTGRTEASPVAAMERPDRGLYGVQFHPEVLHTEHGMHMLRRFLYEAAGCRPGWTMDTIVADTVQALRRRIGSGRAICGLSGGVDSAVAAALVQRAVGEQLTCVFVDHGLLRAGEAEQVEKDFVAATGVSLTVVDAGERFLTALEGVTDPERKRETVGREFIRVFEDAARDVAAAGPGSQPVQFLVQGTLYPDVVESGSGSGSGGESGSGGAASIKSHHNVGGLPDDLGFALVEPLRSLFKDEVRRVGEQLGLPAGIVGRQPFPGPGLAIRIVGEVTRSRLRTLRAADAIARDELARAGLDADIWQCPVVLLADVHSVGVAGDSRTYGHPVVLRPVTSEDAMTADWSRLPYEVLARTSTRITNEVPEVNRVALDVTSKPPGTIEWE